MPTVWQAIGGTDDGSSFSIEVTKFGNNGEFVMGTFECVLINPDDDSVTKEITQGTFEVLRQE